MRPLALVLVLFALGAGVAQAAGDGSHLKRTRLGSYERLASPHAIRVIWLTNSAFGVERVRVREGRHRVVVTVIERVPRAPYTMAGEQRAKRLRLKRPLGTRAVIDGATGRAVASE
jgi:hypothetical protein